MRPSEEAREIEDLFCAFRAWEAQQRENDRQLGKMVNHAMKYGSCTKRFYYSVAEHAGKCIAVDVETEPLRVHDELQWPTDTLQALAYNWAANLLGADRRRKMLLLCHS